MKTCFILEIQNRAKIEKIYTPLPHFIPAGSMERGGYVIFRSGKGLHTFRLHH